MCRDAGFAFRAHTPVERCSRNLWNGPIRTEDRSQPHAGGIGVCRKRVGADWRNATKISAESSRPRICPYPASGRTAFFLSCFVESILTKFEHGAIAAELETCIKIGSIGTSHTLGEAGPQRLGQSDYNIINLSHRA